MGEKKAKKVKNIVFEGFQNSPVMEKLFSASLPARISYPLALLMKRVNECLEIYSAEKKKVIEKYCVQDDKGNPVIEGIGTYNFAPEKRHLFNTEFQELQNLETTVTWDVLELSLEDLEDAGVKLSPLEILSLESIITFADPNTKSESDHETIPSESDKVVQIDEQKRKGE